MFSPIPTYIHAQLVDALGWNVIDRYELKEWEHGMAIEVMHLSDVSFIT